MCQITNQVIFNDQILLRTLGCQLKAENPNFLVENYWGFSKKNSLMTTLRHVYKRQGSPGKSFIELFGTIP